MRVLRRALPLGLAGVMLAASPGMALASSPEFARTAEEWAKLRDNVIEYDELEALVQEYNATVQKNQIDLNEFRKDYGTSKEDVAKRYRELADELEADLSYPDTGDEGYAASMSTIISNESKIKDLRKQADEAVEDLTINRINYESVEASIVNTARTHMINYYLQQLQLQIDEKNLALAQENLQSAETKRTQGLGTDVDVLNAQESIRDAEQAIQSAQTSIENYRQRLQILLGWKHSDSPEVGTLPPVDMTEITSIDVEADKIAAQEKNYTLRINRRKYDNAGSADTKETLEKTIQENVQNINASVYSAYKSVLSAKMSYDLAEAQANLQNRTFNTVSRQYELGNVSRMDYVKGQNSAETAELNRQIAELKLFMSLQNYRATVNGLASSSAM